MAWMAWIFDIVISFVKLNAKYTNEKKIPKSIYIFIDFYSKN